MRPVRSTCPDQFCKHATIAATAAIAAAVRTQHALRVAYLVVNQALEEPGIGTVRAEQWLAVACDRSVINRLDFRQMRCTEYEAGIRVVGTDGSLDPKSAEMKTKAHPIARNVTPVLKGQTEPGRETILRQLLERSADDLLWIAEVMCGNRESAKQSIAEAIELSDAAHFVGIEWIVPWVKRMLVRTTLKRMSSEITGFVARSTSPVLDRLGPTGLSASDRERLRSISPQRIVQSCNALERSCLILFGYLQYSALDCALILGCPRGWIEPICQSVLVKIVELDTPNVHAFRDVDSVPSLGVTECAG